MGGAAQPQQAAAVRRRTQTTSSGYSQFQRQMCPCLSLPLGLWPQPWPGTSSGPASDGTLWAHTNPNNSRGQHRGGDTDEEVGDSLSSAAVALPPRPRTPVEPALARPLRLRHSSPPERKAAEERPAGSPTCRRAVCGSHSMFFNEILANI